MEIMVELFQEKSPKLAQSPDNGPDQTIPNLSDKVSETTSESPPEAEDGASKVSEPEKSFGLPGEVETKV